jgi:hypothetical protein
MGTFLPCHVMGGTEELASAPRYAGIEEQVHAADVSSGGSMRSCPTTR